MLKKGFVSKKVSNLHPYLTWSPFLTRKPALACRHKERFAHIGRAEAARGEFGRH